MSGSMRGRPLVERVFLLLIALLLASGFGVMGAAAWVSGELLLAVMGLVGALMTLWVGLLSLRRG